MEREADTTSAPADPAQRAAELEALVALLSADLDALSRENEALAREREALAREAEGLRSRAEAAESQRDSLAAEVEKLRRLYVLERDRLFGRSSEALPAGQLLLAFNEAEAGLDPAWAPAPAAAGPGGRRGRRGGRRPVDWSRLETEVVDHWPEGGCPSCGGELSQMGFDVVRELVFVPSRLKVVEHRLHKAVCRACSRESARSGGERGAVVLRAAGPAMPLPGSCPSPSLLARVIAQKYATAVPLHRQHAELEAMGFPLCEQVLPSWVIAAHERWLSALWRLLRAEVLSNDIVHADETTLLVVRGTGKSPAPDSYMWLFAAPACAARPAYCFVVGPTRRADVARSFLGGWSGTLVADGYAGYDSLGAGVARSGCLAHVRRPFANAVKSGAAGTDGAICAQAVLRVAAIYRADEPAAGEADGGLARRERVAGMLGDLEGWLASQRPLALPGLDAQKAIDYALGQLPRIRACCGDPRVALDNNLAENAIRPFCVGRRNWLQCDTMRGAEASACIYSLVTTAKANGLNPERWLSWVLSEMPRLGEPQAVAPEQAARFMPWSPDVPDGCRAGAPAWPEPDEPLADVDPRMLDDRRDCRETVARQSQDRGTQKNTRL